MAEEGRRPAGAVLVLAVAGLILGALANRTVLFLVSAVALLVLLAASARRRSSGHAHPRRRRPRR